MASNESHILVINSGSSSLKFTVFNPASEEVLASGMAERLGTDGAGLKLVDLAQKSHNEELPMADPAASEKTMRRSGHRYSRISRS
jgi:acetate kinase